MRRMAGFKVEGVCFFRVEVGISTRQLSDSVARGFRVLGSGFRVRLRSAGLSLKFGAWAYL